jgi:uncharacterized SAM-binding protein YcdF (DUF218 family)
MKPILSAVRRAFRTLLIGAALLWVLSVLLVLLAGAWPTERRADAIVVLGAAHYNGRPSPVLQARLDHALDLYQRGLAPRLIFTGGTAAGDTVSEAEVSRQYARSKGVPDSAIMAEREGLTSAQSVGSAAALMQADGLRTALMVSDPYHMLRLELLARRAGIRPLRAPAAHMRVVRTDSGTRRARLGYKVRYALRESALFPATAILRGR